MAPTKLCHLEQLERHQQALASGTGASGRALAQTYGGERRLDHIGGAQMLPMFGGEVEESNQTIPVGSKRLDRLGVLGLILGLETRPCGLAVGAAIGGHHLLSRALGARIKTSG